MNSTLCERRLRQVNTSTLVQPMRSYPSRPTHFWFTSTLLLLGLLGFPARSAADANPPERMSYQGFLADANGVALGDTTPRNYTAIFRVYTASTGGSTLWTEQQTITVDKGYFSVLLGEGSQLGSEPRPNLSTVFTGTTASERYVGITVKGLSTTDIEIAPRLQLLAAPYSFLARNAVALVNDQGAPFVSVTSGTLAAIGIGAPVQSTGSGGNPRGGKAVDLQLTRDLATQVASGEYSTISGGRRNSATGVNSTMGGGEANWTGGGNSTVAGGVNNQATGLNAAIGGGAGNVAAGEGGTVAGGNGNAASGWHAFVGGGNLNTASGGASVVVGGYNNTAAGPNSFAAGRRARANHNGSFVWADSVDADMGSGAVNEFRIRATGGTRVLGSIANTVETAQQMLVGDSTTGDTSGVVVGFQHNPNVSWSGVIQALGAGGPNTLRINPRGGPVVIGGPLQADGGLTGFGTVPVGGIIMWSGSVAGIPGGWRLCDGGAGTPDLRNRFVIGAGSGYSPGNVGGASTATLTTAQMPSHSHSYVDTYWSEFWGNDSSFGRIAGSPVGADGDNYPYTLGRTTSPAGGGQPVSILPPYYALAFIMRVQ